MSLCVNCSKLAVLYKVRRCAKCSGQVVKNIATICENCANQDEKCECCLKRIYKIGQSPENHIRNNGSGCRSCGGHKN